MSELLPDLPKEIRAVRIGSCYNSLTRSLMGRKSAIDPIKLDPKAINFVEGKAVLQLRADASTSQNANDTYFSVDSKVKFGSWISVGFNMETSQSDINTKDTMSSRYGDCSPYPSAEPDVRLSRIRLFTKLIVHQLSYILTYTLAGTIGYAFSISLNPCQL